METKKQGAYENFLDNIKPIMDKISPRSAYLGVMVGAMLFFFSLFFAWSKVRDISNVADNGMSTGWAEAGYVAIFPLLFIIYRIAKNKRIPVFYVLIAAIVSLLLLVYNNILSRSTWSSHTHCSDGDCQWGHNFGSDLGGGFWIGLLTLVVIVVCGLSWALHKMEPDKSQSSSHIHDVI